MDCRVKLGIQISERGCLCWEPQRGHTWLAECISLFLRRRQCGKGIHPGKRRAAPDLSLWRKCRALGDGTCSQGIALRVLNSAGEHRRAASSAKRMAAFIAAVRRFHIALGRAAQQPEVFSRRRDICAERGAGEPLAIRAVANAHHIGIDFGLECNLAAMAVSVDLHAVAFILRKVFRLRSSRRSAISQDLQIYSRNRL